MFLLSVVKVMLAPGAAASLSFALGFFYELKLWLFMILWRAVLCNYKHFAAERVCSFQLFSQTLGTWEHGSVPQTNLKWEGTPWYAMPGRWSPSFSSYTDPMWQTKKSRNDLFWIFLRFAKACWPANHPPLARKRYGSGIPPDQITHLTSIPRW